ncbi:MAG: cation diffusion facilitator family transporter [Candidatus Gastranaerophilales bacterium]|nr:cation diffusion facilitator family transporter [Candidatus Gastranaerophilales bacterium]
MEHNHPHCHTHKSVNKENAKKTLVVICITLITMVVEILYGFFTNSMALLSDGWHMGTHALALLLTYIAYVLSQAFCHSEKFPHGTDKIPVLAGYTSSLFLGLTGILVIAESVQRFFNPLQISFNSAIIVAVLGLVVNGICLIVMHTKDSGKDYNYKAAYLHILADAMTSVFAIIALLAGKFFGLVFLDAIMGIVGGLLILKWSKGLIKDTSAVLLDMKNEICD